MVLLLFSNRNVDVQDEDDFEKEVNKNDKGMKKRGYVSCPFR